MGINWARKTFHILSSLIIFIIAVKSNKETYIAFLFLVLCFVFLFEVLRLRFGERLPLRNIWLPLLKEREKGSLSDASWFCLGLFFASLIGPHEYQPLIVLLLGLADPSAEIIGKKFGKIKNHLGKSLEGSIGFALTSLAIASFYISAPLWMIFILFVLPITLLEYFCLRDNLWIPVASAIFVRLFFH